MLILGFHGGRGREDEVSRAGFEFHDSAAVLLEDGEVIAAIEEERLNRIKHSNHFPARAIRFCLESRHRSLEDIDWIATNFDEAVVDLWAKLDFLEYSHQRPRPKGRQTLSTLFAHEFGVEVADKLRFCKHHVAHAWSAYALSGYENGLILTLDGAGDNLSGSVSLGLGGRLTKLREFNLSKSLGEFYARTIKLLGYSRFDEYKVMGLAPYGNPTVYAGLFDSLYRLLPEGGYELEGTLASLSRFEEAGLVAQARRAGAPFTQTHKDLAASLQAALERITLHVLTHFRNTTGQRNLCVAGGVAHNSTMNGKALYSGLFDRIFVQPAAHDAGGALGAALHVWSQERPTGRRHPLRHVFWGTDIGGDAEIERALSRWHGLLTFERVDDISLRTAQLIGEGAVIGWVQGRSEFGPRALGARSILADPRPAENKQLINQMVKKREGYRPFAPSVLEERVADFFETPTSQSEFPFMTFVLNVRPEVRSLLGAVTHVDGTARVQTVSRTTNPRYWELIHAFGQLTGVPILLNTSFNNNVEPIVDSIDEAITCFLTTGIHYLAAGNYLVSKRELSSSDPVWRSLAPSLPLTRRLAKRHRNLGCGRRETVWEIDSMVDRIFGQSTIALLPDTFSLLRVADGTKSLRELTELAGVSDEERAAPVLEQVMELWLHRAVTLLPIESDRRQMANASAAQDAT